MVVLEVGQHLLVLQVVQGVEVEVIALEQVVLVTLQAHLQVKEIMVEMVQVLVPLLPQVEVEVLVQLEQLVMEEVKVVLEEMAQLLL
jgi:hypothetical protein